MIELERLCMVNSTEDSVQYQWIEVKEALVNMGCGPVDVELFLIDLNNPEKKAAKTDWEDVTGKYAK